jgi:uncharacterized protein
MLGNDGPDGPVGPHGPDHPAGPVGPPGHPGAALGTVTGLARHPVKSLQGEDCFTLDFDRRGAAGDRLWALRTADGAIAAGKNTRRFRRVPGLLDYSAVYDRAVPVIVTPDGARLRGDDPSAHLHLSDLLGQPVGLSRESDVWHMDAGAVHIVTTASLRAIGDADPRRFRPNIVIDNDEPWAEDQWTGRSIAIGPTLRLRVTGRTERCAMVNMAQPGLPPEPALLRRLADSRDLAFGIYADVTAPGTVTLGDRCTME